MRPTKNKPVRILVIEDDADILEPASGKASSSLLNDQDEYLFDVKAALQKTKKTGLPAGGGSVGTWMWKNPLS